MKVAQYSACDTVNGKGIRCSLWVSGCTLNCRGCFSPEAQDFAYGVDYDVDFMDRILRDLSQNYIQGLSILGGHMFELPNYLGCLDLIKKIKFQFPQKDIYVWSGRTLEAIENHSLYQESLNWIDVLIDGPFVESKKDLTLLWRGSSNQRILHRGQDY
jgi:anaerobic ribonucleoside-triphosphate reductase activating protein